MTESTVKSNRRKPSREERSPIASAPRQPAATQAWKHFAGDLLAALRALDEDEYLLDLAQPVPMEDVAVLAVLTLEFVHSAGHPGNLEYGAKSAEGGSIRFPHLPIRRREAKAPA